MQDNSISHTRMAVRVFILAYIQVASDWIHTPDHRSTIWVPVTSGYASPPAQALRQHKRAETDQKVSERLYSREPQLGEHSLRVDSSLLK